MSRSSRVTLTAIVAAAALAALPGFSFAQETPAPADDQHHADNPADAPVAPPVSNPMGGNGAMGSGGTGMMGGSSTNDMMQMMTMMRSMMPMMGAASNMMSSHVEDRIAALKEELKISDAQLPQWSRFADALRGASHSMSGMYQQMIQQNAGSLPERLDAHERLLAQHLVSLRALKDALMPLYPTLTDSQRKQLDGLMIGPMGMM